MSYYDVLDHSPIGYFVLDNDFKVVYWNKCLVQWTEIAPDEIIGKSVFSFFSHLEGPKYSNRIKSVLNGGPPLVFSAQLHRYCIPAYLPGGKTRIQQTIVTSIPTKNPDEYHALFAIQDETTLSSVLDNNKEMLRQLISEIDIRKETEKKLSYMAQFDALTGLANRTLFNEFLSQTLARTERQGSLFALLFLDLDHFKNVNDTLGHDAGDELLIQVADQLKNCVRSSDLVSRFGGDEFAIIMDVKQPEDAAKVSEKIITEISTPFDLSAKQVQIGVSIGIALYPADGKTADKLRKSADTAMYHAKHCGKNNYQYFVQEMHDKATAQMTLENDIKKAISQEDFDLYMQPQIDASTGKPLGMEALIRWPHASRGMISPAEFIPASEKCGLIIPIGDWVMRKTCQCISMLTDNSFLPDSFRIAVNVAVPQLQQKQYVETVKQIIDETGVDPKYLEIELTESTMMDAPERIRSVLHEFHEMGVRIALDDFGTGYSSLNSLGRLPVNCIKIDLSFVQNIGKDSNDELIIKSMIALAHGLDLQVVAEGVETQDQIDFLRHHGCDLLQGYFFSRPIPFEEARLFLANSNYL